MKPAAIRTTIGSTTGPARIARRAALGSSAGSCRRSARRFIARSARGNRSTVQGPESKVRSKVGRDDEYQLWTLDFGLWTVFYGPGQMNSSTRISRGLRVWQL